MGDTCSQPDRIENTKKTEAAGTARAESHFRTSPYYTCDIIDTLTDPRFGEIQILDDIGTTSIFKKTIKYQSPRGFSQSAENKATRVNFDEKFFAKLYDYDCDVSRNSEYFSDTGKEYYIDCYYQLIDSDLKQEISDRKKSDDMFSEHELLQLSKSMITANAFLQTNKMRHGDIRPDFILYDSDTESWKLIENIRYFFIKNFKN